MIGKTAKGSTVAVAMSGGVDSSVAACLLAEQGYRVIGLTMRLFCYSEKPSREKACCNTQAIADARAVCDRIGADHYVIGGEQEFKRDVIRRFVGSYLAGETPNPCVDCNTYIKFNYLLRKAISLEVDFLATGHYVRLERKSGKPMLLRGLDREKDQSYFLCGIPRAALERLMFPLGEYRKPDVRELAAKYDLAVKEKVESQEICFVENDSVEEFIREFNAEERGSAPAPASTLPGPVVDGSGKVVGEHRGSAFYTIGQRKGLGVSLGRPAYVVRIDIENNEIEVGWGDDLSSTELTASRINALADLPEMPFRSGVQIRYRHTPVGATVEADGDNGVRVRMDEPQRAVARGQSVVFYRDDLVLGGAVITGAEALK